MKWTEMMLFLYEVCSFYDKHKPTGAPSIILQECSQCFFLKVKTETKSPFFQPFIYWFSRCVQLWQPTSFSLEGTLGKTTSHQFHIKPYFPVQGPWNKNDEVSFTKWRKNKQTKSQMFDTFWVGLYFNET